MKYFSKATPVKDYKSYKMGDLSQEIQDIVILNESRYSEKFALIVWTKDFPRQYGISLEKGKMHSELIVTAVNNFEKMKEALEGMVNYFERNYSVPNNYPCYKNAKQLLESIK